MPVVSGATKHGALSRSETPSQVAVAVEHGRQAATVLLRHQDQLLVFIKRELSPALAAHVEPEDIVQEVWMRVRRQAAAHGHTPNLAYLCAAAHSCIVDAWRRHHRQCRNTLQDKRLPFDTWMQSEMGLECTKPGPLSSAEKNEDKKLLSEAFKELSEKDRKILTLRVCQRLPLLEVAKRLALKVPTAYVHYYKALERLKTVLHSRFPDGVACSWLPDEVSPP